jgi:hypothetical protein
MFYSIKKRVSAVKQFNLAFSSVAVTTHKRRGLENLKFCLENLMQFESAGLLVEITRKFI